MVHLVDDVEIVARGRSGLHDRPILPAELADLLDDQAGSDGRCVAVLRPLILHVRPSVRPPAVRIGPARHEYRRAR